MKKYLILKQLEHQEKENKLHQTKQKSEEQEMETKNVLITKLNKVNERINKKKKDNENEAVIKFELLTWKREDNYKNVCRNDKIQDYIREQKMNTIYVRMKKIDDMKNEKLMIAEEKRKLQEEIKRKKEVMVDKFAKLLKKGKLDRNEIYKEINLLKGEKVDADSYQPHHTARDRSHSDLSDEDYQLHFNTENDKSTYLNTESDNKVVSTIASYRDS